ncbi:MAG: N-acetyltransferase, partial [Chitinophagaceae bacterium]
LDQLTDCCFAPSVADNWQNQGVGNALFDFVLEQVLFIGFSRIILWGGVQASNENAIQYYKKLGFETLGSFEYQGLNYDMILNIGGA